MNQKGYQYMVYSSSSHILPWGTRFKLLNAGGNQPMLCSNEKYKLKREKKVCSKEK